MPDRTGIISASPFGYLPDGAKASLFTLHSPGGLRLTITDFGGAIVSLWAPDRHGTGADVVLGYDNVAGYVAGRSFFGGIIGRYGNRIARGRFSMDGVEHSLAVNNGPNALHGGPRGFHTWLWEAWQISDTAVRFHRDSVHGEEGYPGNLRVEVTYSLVEGNALRIDYAAETDRPTVINLTNHSYFNLGGHDSGSILDHELVLAADHFTPTDTGLIPTGELRPVAGTAFDFRQPHRIGERIGADDEQLRAGGGYDHNFVLAGQKKDGLNFAARFSDAGSGRILEVFTTEPAIQFYSGNFLDGTEIGKGGHPYGYRTGICLETQHFPDSPNHPSFPSTILRPGERYISTTVYQFSAR